jgi:hypothetical protein
MSGRDKPLSKSVQRKSLIAFLVVVLAFFSFVIALTILVAILRGAQKKPGQSGAGLSMVVSSRWVARDGPLRTTDQKKVAVDCQIVSEAGLPRRTG